MTALAIPQADLTVPVTPLHNARPLVSRSRELAVVAGAAAQLPGATLDEVVAAAGLQTRLDRKYLIGPDTLAQLMARLASRFQALEIDRRRQFRYESVYFDTPELALYRQHLQGRRRRYKVRTRSYLDSGQCLFEVKLKGRRGQTIKARLPYRMADRTRITAEARDFLAELLQTHYGIDPPPLQPSATITYVRATLVDFHTGVRPTLDVDLACTHCGDTVPSRGGILIETKSPTHDSPVDRALRQLGARPLKLSKYGLAVAVLYPGVPANPLHRTLRAYFGWQPTPTPSPATSALPCRPQELDRQVSPGSTRASRPPPPWPWRCPSIPRPRFLLALGFVAALAMAGCGGNNGENTSSAQPATTTTAAAATSTTVAATTTTAGAISRAQARAIALRAAGGGRVTEIEQDDEDNRQVWKVKVRKGSVTRKVSIDQQTGKVVKIERDTDDNDGND